MINNNGKVSTLTNQPTVTSLLVMHRDDQCENTSVRCLKGDVSAILQPHSFTCTYMMVQVQL